MMDWIFVTEEGVCDLRTAGVLIRNGRIVVQRDRDGSEYAIPGGHVRIGETTQDALLREYREETGAAVRILRLLWTEECFWEMNGRRMHNLTFYYLIELCEGSDIPDKADFLPHHDNDRVMLGWMPVDQLQHVTIYPDFIKNEIHQLADHPKHFISRY